MVLFVVIVLLIANAVFTGVMWFKMRHKNQCNHQIAPPPPPPGRGRFIIDELGMDSMQSVQFKKIADEHFKQLDALKEKEHQLKDSFFTLFKADTASKETVLLYANRAASVQAEIDTLNYANFQRIKAICTEEQKLKFFDIIQRIFMSPPPENQGPRPMPMAGNPSRTKDSFSNHHPPRFIPDNRPPKRTDQESFAPPHRPEGAPDGPPPGFRDGHRPPPPPRRGDGPGFNHGDFPEDGPPPPPRPDHN